MNEHFLSLQQSINSGYIASGVILREEKIYISYPCRLLEIFAGDFIRRKCACRSWDTAIGSQHTRKNQVQKLDLRSTVPSWQRGMSGTFNLNLSRESLT